MQTWKKLKENPDLWQSFFLREKIIKSIRDFFYRENFHEVETPLLTPAVIPESYLDVFETNLSDRYGHKKKMFLTTSPEVYLKKLLVAGIGNCFEITKSFRNGETRGKFHHPEFTILEWYRVGADYKNIMRDCEDLVMHIYKNIRNQKSEIRNTNQKSKIKKSEIVYQNKKINLNPPWERISIVEALNKYADINFDDLTDDNQFPPAKIAQIAKKKGYEVAENNSWEEIFNQIFLNEIEPHLGTDGKPTIIYDYPKPLAALAKTKKDDPRLVERFEFYIAGLESGDGCSELTDYDEQKKRFKSELSLIRNKNKTEVFPDEDFLEALKIGLPNCAGVAVGIDRLVMLFADASSIEDILLFPLAAN
jgi:EF-P lysine aminoacylase GenX